MKKSAIVEADGEPFGITITIAVADVLDAHLFESTIEAIVLERPPVEDGYEQHLTVDKGDDNDSGYRAYLDHAYELHIELIRDTHSPRPKRYPPRRWVVERTLPWLSMCRGVMVRWEKKSANYLWLLKLACGLLWFRRYQRLNELT